MKRIKALGGLFAITAGWMNAYASYDFLPSSNGPAAGGNTLLVTNYVGAAFGSGADVTNVVFSNATQEASATSILGQGTNWVRVVVPAHATGAVDLVVQSSGLGNTTLASPQYTFNPAGSIGGGLQWMEYRVTFDDNGANPVYPTNTAQDGLSRWTQFHRTNQYSVELMSTGAVLNAAFLRAYGYSTLYTGPAWVSNYSWISLSAANTFIYLAGANSNRVVITNLLGTSYQVDVVDSYPSTDYRCYMKVFEGVWNYGDSTAGGSWGTNNSVWQNPGGGGNNASCTNAYYNPDRYITWTNVVPSNGAISLVQWSIAGQYNFLNCMRISGFEPAGGGGSGGVTPASGSSFGGYQVTIAGTNLCNGSDVTNVTLCGANVTAINSQSATQIVVTAGAGTVGLGDVRVYSASYGVTVASNLFTYLALNPNWVSAPVTNATDGDLYTYTLGAVDTTGKDVSFTASNLPSWLALTSSGGGNGGLINTFAGTGVSGVPTNGAAASNAPVTYPYGLHIDSVSNVYIADYSAHRVYKVDNQGVITRFVGTGSAGSTGDGGAASNAAVNGPLDVTVDAAGNVYIVEYSGNRIRKVGTNGVISTYAGTGTSGFSGDGGAATNAKLSYPRGVAVDMATNIYISDTQNGRIRKVSPAGTITTIAGKGGAAYSGDGGAATNAQFNYPWCLSVDATGNVFVADFYNNRVRKITPGGTISTVAGTGTGGYSGDGGAATNAMLYYPLDVVVDTAGRLYISDYVNYRLRKVETNGVISTFAGKGVNGYTGDGGSATNASMRSPYGLAVDGNRNVLFVDGGGYRIRRVTSSAATWTLSGTPGTAQAGTSTNLTLRAVNVSGVATQNFSVAIAGRARPLVKSGSLVVSNGVAASAVFGTDFGTVASNQSQVLTLSLTNFGTAALTISGVSTSGSSASYFTISNLPTAVAVGTASNFLIVYRPLGVGAHGATLSLTNNGTNTPYVINVAGSGVRPGEIGVNRGLLSYTATYGGSNPAAQSFVITNKGGSGFSYSNMDGAAWFTLAPVTGYVNAAQTWPHTGTVSIAGLDAGVYVATNTIDSALATNAPVDILVHLTLAQATQAIAFAAIADQTITNTVGLSATASSGNPVSFTVASGPGSISGSTNLSFTGDGTVLVVASQTGSVNYAAAPARTNAVNVSKVTATLALTNLSYTYDGNAHTATVTTLPAGLNVVVTYDSGAAPSNAGSYGITADISETNYIGTATGTLTIGKANQTITFPAIADQNLTNAVGLSATASSSNAVTFSVASGMATITGGTNLLFSGIGQCRIAAAQTGDANWNAAATVTNTINVSVMPSWVSVPVTNATDGSLYTYALSANDALGSAISITASSLPPWLALTSAGGSPIISTFAGTGVSGVPTNGAAASNAPVTYPYGLHIDSVSNVYIADYSAHRVYKVDNQGVITRFVGTGSAGSTGDGGAASNAAVNGPLDVTADAAGNVYIVEYSGHRIRKVGTNGVISTFAGTGTSGFSGDGGAATSAQLYYPRGVAVDAVGNVYVSDTQNGRIRKISTGGTITTLAGKGGFAYSGDNGPATNAQFYTPWCLSVDAAGNVFVGDFNNNRVRKISAGGTITTVAGTGTGGYGGDGGAATNAMLYYPLDVVVDTAGRLYISDYVNYRVRKVETNGVISTLAGKGVNGYSGDGGAATNAMIRSPYGMAVDGNGNVLFIDGGGYRIRRVTSSAATWTLSGTPGPAHVGVTNVQLDASNGTRSAPQNFTIQVAGLGRPLVLNAAGAIVSNGLAASSTLGTDFGTVGTNEVRALNLSLTNFGSAVLQISGVSTSGAGAAYFTVSNLPASVGIGAVSNFTVNFAPGALGVQSANIAITNNGTNTPYVIKVAGTGAKPGEIGLNRGSFSFSATYGGANPAAQTYVITNKGGVGFAYSNTSGAAWFSVASVTGYLGASAIKTHTGSVAIAGLNAGSYTITNAVLSPTASNSPVEILVQLTLAKASQSINFPSLSNQTVTSTVVLSATAGSGLPVSFSVANGPGVIAGGTNLSFTADGSVYVVASQTGNVNYAAGTPVTNRIDVAKATATVNLSGLSQVFDGSVKTATVTTIPAGLGLMISYSPDSAPTNAGSYTVTASVSDTNYTGEGTGTLTIAKANQAITNFPAIATQNVTNAVGLFAQANSGLPVTNFVVASGPGSIAGGTTLTFSAAGTVRVAATQAGDNNWNAAAPVTNAVTVVGGLPVWTSVPITNATEGQLYTYSLTATDPGGQSLTFRTSSVPPWLSVVQAGGSPIISTFAGNGSSGTPTNGVQATNAAINWPYGLTYDGAGNAYIADYSARYVYKVTPAGVISKVAGTGSSTSSGDGGPATSAGIAGPLDVAADAAGNLYIADYMGHRIRKVDAASGTISTIAGTGSSGYSGDGGAATSARLYYPIGVAVDAAGNVFVSDYSNHRIRKIGTDGIIRTVAGTGTWGYSGDGGAGTNAMISGPWGTDIDAAGNLYFAEYGGYRIRRLGTDGIIRTVAGTGTGGYNGDGIAATNAKINYPMSVAVNAVGELYVADGMNYRLRKVGTNGVITTVAGKGTSGFTGDGGAATNATIGWLYGVAVNTEGDVLVMDSNNRRVRRLTGNAATWTLTGTPGPAHVGITNAILLADNGTTNAAQNFPIQVLGIARPLVLNPASGKLVSNNVPASVTLGTDFGMVVTNTASVLTLSLTNFGTAALQVTNVTVSGAGASAYTVSNLPGVVSVGGISNFTVNFAPVALGAQAAGITLAHNGTNAPHVINVAGGGVRPGEIAVNRASLGFTATYGGSNPAAQTLTITNKGGLAFAYTNTIAYADGSGWLTITPAAGNAATGAVINVHTARVSLAGLDAGAYGATLNVVSPTASNSPVELVVQLTLAQASQTITFPAVATQTVGASVGLSATASSGLAATFAVASGPGTLSGGTNLACTAEGTIRVVASQAGNVNYTAAVPVTNTFNVIKATAGVALTNLSHTYDGTEKTAAYQTSPTGLTCVVTYNGSAASPQDAGSYTVVASVSDASYGGAATGTLTIAKANQTITSFPAIAAQNVQNTVVLSATASSGLDVTNFVVVSGPGVVTGGTNLGFTTAGTVLVAATQAGDNNWNAAPNVTNAVSVISDPTWTSTPVTDATDGEPYTYTLTATDPGGASVSFTNVTLPSWLSVVQAGGSPIIRTFAGNGSSGTPTNGAAATNAAINWPYGLAYDSAGNAYIADYSARYVYKVTPAGVISKVAGTGSSTSSGDGGPATNAGIAGPLDVAADAAGNLYIADYMGHRIRKVDAASGTISTIAGTGVSGYSGDGGAATSARLYYPIGVAVDAAGNVFVSDYSNHRIRKIGTDGIIRTVAGTGTWGYSGDGGAGTNAMISGPWGTDIDAAGNLYFAEYGGYRIRRLGTDGIIRTVVGTGTGGYNGDGIAATNAQINYPMSVAVNAAGELYVADGMNARLRKVGANGIITTVAGKGTSGFTGDGGPATNATIGWLYGVAVNTSGDVLLMDSNNRRVRRLTGNAATWTLTGTPGPAHVGQTNVTLYASNGSRSTPQAFTITIAGRARPLALGTNGASLWSGTAASSAAGTDFGTVPTNTYATATLTLTNYGTADLWISGVTTSGAGKGSFALDGFPSLVSVGDAGAFTVTYTPTNLGPHPATFTFTHNGTNTPYTINVAGSGIKPGEMRVQGTFLDFTATYGGTNPAAQSFTLQNVGGVPFNYSNTVGYGAGASGWLTVAPNVGVMGASTSAPLTGTVSVAGLNVGAYWATNAVSATNAVNSAMEVLARVTVNKAAQTITSFPAIPAQVISNTVGLAATASSGLPVSFSVVSGPGSIASGTNLSFTADGSVDVVASQAGNSNYLAAASVTQRVDVSKMTASVALSGLSHVYDGNIKTATVTTVPASLPYVDTYNAGSAPSNVGSYAVQVTLTDSNYQGSATGTLTIAKANQAIAGFPAIGDQHVTNTVALGATASSGLPVSYAIVSGPGAVSGSTLSFSGVGNVVLAAIQAGDGNWNAAPSLTNTVRVYSVPRWTSTPVTNATDGMLYTYDLTVTEPANLPVTITGPVLPSWLTVTNGGGSGFTISTVAGNGTYGYSGDGGQATNAAIKGAASMAMDAAGNLYVADLGGHRIRKVRPDGVIETFAGTGTAGSSGDGGQATGAQLQNPYGVAVDGAGIVYVADSGNHRIRRIGTDGIITTIAGTGTGGYSGDGGAATSAQLKYPVGVGVDSAGNVYVADYSNHRMRRIGTDGIIRTLAGTGTGGYNGDGIAATNAQVNGPARVAVDAAGAAYVVELNGHRVRKIGTDGIIQTIAGTGTGGYNGDGIAATNAQLNGPFGLSLDASGVLYVADYLNHRIRRVGTNGLIETVAGVGTYGFSGDGGAATNAKINYPLDVTVVGTAAYVADYANNRVRKLTSQTPAWRLTGTPGPAHVGVTNVSLQADNGISNATQSFALQVAGLPRMRALNAAGAVISNSVAASSALGTDFGTVATNESRAIVLGLTNFGSASLQISGVTTSGAGAAFVTVSNLPAVVAAGTISNFMVNYAPGALGSHAVALTLTHNGTNTPYVINVAGAGVKPGEIWLNRTLVSYTATYGGSNPAPEIMMITNKGAAPFDYSLSQTYDEQASGWLTVAGATGHLEVAGIGAHTGTVSLAGLDAGTYVATNAIGSPTAINSPVDIQIVLTIQQASQSITFPALAAQWITNRVGLSATAGSGLPVEFTVVSGPGSISGATNLAFTAEGSVYVEARQPGNVNYQAAPAVTNRVDVNRLAATVSLGNLNQVFDGSAKTVTVTTVPSSLPVTVTYDGNTVAPTNAGAYNVLALIQDDIYSGQQTGTLTIAKASQTVTFPALADQNVTNRVGLSATASTGLPVTFSVASGPATLSSGTNVSFTGVGSVRVTANQAGDNNYNPQTATNTFTVYSISLAVLGTNGAAIASGEAAAAGKGANFGQVPVGLPVTNRLTLSNPGTHVLTLSGITVSGANAASFQASGPSQVSAASTGMLTVIFNPAVTGSYAALVTLVNDSTTTPYVVNLAGEAIRRSQTIAFTAIADQSSTATVTLAATASSGLPVSFSVVSGPATLNGMTLSFTAAGAVSVAASQAGDTTWAAAPTVTQTFTVGKAGQTITFAAIPDQAVSNTVRLSATASSGLPVSFSVASGPGTLSGGTNLSFTSAGTVNVAASQAGDVKWAAAPTVTQSVIVLAATQTVVTLPTVETLSVLSTMTTGAWVRAELVFNGGGTISARGVCWSTATNPTVADPHTVEPFNTEGIFTNAIRRLIPATDYHVRAYAANTVGTNYGTDLQFTTRAFETTTENDSQGMGRSDVVSYDAVSNTWTVTTIEGTVVITLNMGSGGTPLTGDYDGDGKTDFAVYDEETGTWKVALSSAGYAVSQVQLGGSGMTPETGDYDGDGKTDFAVYDEATGEWTVALSSKGYAVSSFTFGGEGYDANAADYDGDGIDDPVVYDDATGEMYLVLSGSGYQMVSLDIGGEGFVMVPGDYDGDGIDDPAMYCEATGEWVMYLSGSGYEKVTGTLGGTGMVPVPGDYDGDGSTDVAVYNEVSGEWYVYTVDGTPVEISDALGTGSGSPVSDTGARLLVGVHRYARVGFDYYHVYTIDDQEIAFLDASADWVSEGVVWYAAREEVEGLLPVWRLYEPGRGLYHWTVSQENYNQLVVAGCEDQGKKFYMSATSAPGAAAVYQLYHSGYQVYYYTASLSDAIQMVSQGWVGAVSTCYGYAAGSGSTTLSGFLKK